MLNYQRVNHVKITEVEQLEMDLDAKVSEVSSIFFVGSSWWISGLIWFDVV